MQKHKRTDLACTCVILIRSATTTQRHKRIKEKIKEKLELKCLLFVVGAICHCQSFLFFFLMKVCLFSLTCLKRAVGSLADSIFSVMIVFMDSIMLSPPILIKIRVKKRSDKSYFFTAGCHLMVRVVTHNTVVLFLFLSVSLPQSLSVSHICALTHLE